MSLLSMNLHVASLGMHRDPKKGESAAYQVVDRLQSSVQRSRHAIANFVRECLVDVLNPVQVSLQPLSHQHLCIHHWSMSCNLALVQLLQHSQSFVSWVWILRSIRIIEGSFAERTAGTMAKSLQGLHYAAARQEIISDCMDWPQSVEQIATTEMLGHIASSLLFDMSSFCGRCAGGHHHLKAPGILLR